MEINQKVQGTPHRLWKQINKCENIGQTVVPPHSLGKIKIRYLRGNIMPIRRPYQEVDTEECFGSN